MKINSAMRIRFVNDIITNKDIIIEHEMKKKKKLF